MWNLNIFGMCQPNLSANVLGGMCNRSYHIVVETMSESLISELLAPEFRHRIFRILDIPVLFGEVGIEKAEHSLTGSKSMYRVPVCLSPSNHNKLTCPTNCDCSPNRSFSALVLRYLEVRPCCCAAPTHWAC